MNATELVKEDLCHVSLFQTRETDLASCHSTRRGKKKKKCHPFIMNRETPTGFCHWDEKKELKPGHSALSNREPFKSSDNQQEGGRERERKGDTKRGKERWKGVKWAG